MPVENTLSERLVVNWLSKYGLAWRRGDPDLVASLFSLNAVYQETPFDAVMEGREAIKAYWEEGAATAQEGVEFTSEVWSIEGLTVIAGWQARFIRKRCMTQVELNGVFRLKFASLQRQLLCESLEEWWHRRERTQS